MVALKDVELWYTKTLVTLSVPFVNFKTLSFTTGPFSFVKTVKTAAVVVDAPSAEAKVVPVEEPQVEVLDASSL